LGHALLEGAATDHQRHLTRVVGKEQRRLPGRVAGADEVDVQTAGPAGFAARGAIVDALADQPLKAGYRQAPPSDAGGQYHGACAYYLVLIQEDLVRLRLEPRHATRDDDFGPQTPCLLQRAARQLITRYSARKAQIILDAGGGAGLTARRLA